MTFSFRAAAFTILLALAAPAHASVIDWGSNWNGTNSGTYVVDGVTVVLSTAPDVSTSALQGTCVVVGDCMTVSKPGADQTWSISFSEAVNFSIGFAHINDPAEWLTNFSVGPSSVSINSLHTWNGATLGASSTSTTAISTLSWIGITGFSFDHHWTGSSTLSIVDGELTVPSAVPLPAALPLLLVALGSLGFAARRRKAT